MNHALLCSHELLGDQWFIWLPQGLKGFGPFCAGTHPGYTPGKDQWEEPLASKGVNKGHEHRGLIVKYNYPVADLRLTSVKSHQLANSFEASSTAGDLW